MCASLGRFGYAEFCHLQILLGGEILLAFRREIPHVDLLPKSLLCGEGLIVFLLGGGNCRLCIVPLLQRIDKFGLRILDVLDRLVQSDKRIPGCDFLLHLGNRFLIILDLGRAHRILV